MMRRINILLLLVLTALLLLQVGSAGAMFSTNYRLDWFTPLTGGGGGHAYSSSYAVDLTIGQAVIGAAFSTDYAGGLGYWYGLVTKNFMYLPIVTRK